MSRGMSSLSLLSPLASWMGSGLFHVGHWCGAGYNSNVRGPLWSGCWWPGTVLHPRHILSHFILPTTKWVGYHHSHLTDQVEIKWLIRGHILGGGRAGLAIISFQNYRLYPLSWRKIILSSYSRPASQSKVGSVTQFGVWSQGHGEGGPLPILSLSSPSPPPQYIVCSLKVGTGSLSVHCHLPTAHSSARHKAVPRKWRKE